MNKNNIELLLSKINVIQNELLKYCVVNALIFGSMIKGTNKLFSDFDVAIKADNLKRSVKRSRKDRALGFDAEHICHFIIDEVGIKLRYILNMDVNFDISFDDDTYENSLVYSPRLEIIKDGMIVDRETLRERIIEIQKTEYTVPEPRSVGSQQFRIFQTLAGYIPVSRYYPYIHTINEFLFSEDKHVITMRNETIYEIAELCLLTEKIDEEILKSTFLPLESMKNISKLVREKQVTAENFNPSAVGWDVCCEMDLTADEMKTFLQFYLDSQKFNLAFIERTAGDPNCQEKHEICQSALDDEKGFISSLETIYRKKTNYEFVDVFNRLIQMIS